MNRGYTLVELVVVLLVLALAAAVVLPSVGRSVESLRLRAEVAGVASFLRGAREQAITRDSPYEVAVDPKAGLLVLRAVVNETASASDRSVAAKRLSAPIRIDVDPPQARIITFLPQGLSSGGRLRIGAPGPVVYTVTVDALTGRVSTRRGES